MKHLAKLVIVLLNLMKCAHQADLNIGKSFIEFKSFEAAYTYTAGPKSTRSLSHFIPLQNPSIHKEIYA